jgi:hypothetical protein
MNKNLPPLTDILPKGSEAGMEFERLMKKLLIHDDSELKWLKEELPKKYKTDAFFRLSPFFSPKLADMGIVVLLCHTNR